MKKRIFLLLDNLTEDINFRELMKGSSTSFFFQIAGLVIGFLLTYLIANVFGAETMGIFSLSMAVLSMVTIFSRLGLDTALVKLLAANNSFGQVEVSLEMHRKAVKIIFAVNLFLTIVTFLLAPVIAESFFKNPSLTTYFRIISLAIFPLTLISINGASFRGLKQIKRFSYFRDVSVSFFNLLFLATLSPFVTATTIPLYTYLASVIIAAVHSEFLWIKSSRTFIAGKTAARIRVSEILRISLPMLIAGSMFIILQWTDTILIGIFRTERDVGVYNVAAKIASLATLSLIAINSIAAPKLAELFSQGKIEELGVVVHQCTKLIFWTSLPVVLVLAVLSPYLLRFFGSSFKLGAAALIVLLAGYFINAISGSVGFLLQMTGRQKAFQNIIVIAAVINIILNFLLIPIFGITGSAFATAISMSFWNLAAVTYIKNKYGFTSFYLPFLRK